MKTFHQFVFENVWGNITIYQGRIYVANEYPTFAKTMSMVSQKLTFLRHITFGVRQNLSVLMKIMQILGQNILILEFFSTLL